MTTSIAASGRLAFISEQPAPIELIVVCHEHHDATQIAAKDVCRNGAQWPRCSRRLHRLGTSRSIELVGPPPQRLPWTTLKRFRNGFDHMKVSNSKAGPDVEAHSSGNHLFACRDRRHRRQFVAYPASEAARQLRSWRSVCPHPAYNNIHRASDGTICFRTRLHAFERDLTGRVTDAIDKHAAFS
jgi:hypothetical protein